MYQSFVSDQASAKQGGLGSPFLSIGDAMRSFFLVLLIFAAGPIRADQFCVDRYLSSQIGKTTYRANYQGMGTEVERELSQTEDGRWELTQRLDMLLVALDERSLFTSSQAGLETLEYRYEQRGLGKRTLDIRVDSTAQQVVTHYKDRSGSYSWQPGIVDTLSHILQVQIDRACQLTDGDAIEVSLVKRSGIKDYRYLKSAIETIELPVLGAVEVELWLREEGDVKDQLWLAPAHEFQMIRFSHEEGDERSSLIIRPESQAVQ